jgi:hypothetical protein
MSGAQTLVCRISDGPDVGSTLTLQRTDTRAVGCGGILMMLLMYMRRTRRLADCTQTLVRVLLYDSCGQVLAQEPVATLVHSVNFRA